MLALAQALVELVLVDDAFVLSVLELGGVGDDDGVGRAVVVGVLRGRARRRVAVLRGRGSHGDCAEPEEGRSARETREAEGGQC